MISEIRLSHQELPCIDYLLETKISPFNRIQWGFITVYLLKRIVLRWKTTHFMVTNKNIVFQSMRNSVQVNANLSENLVEFLFWQTFHLFHDNWYANHNQSMNVQKEDFWKIIVTQSYSMSTSCLSHVWMHVHFWYG